MEFLGREKASQKWADECSKMSVKRCLDPCKSLAQQQPFVLHISTDAQIRIWGLLSRNCSTSSTSCSTLTQVIRPNFQKPATSSKPMSGTAGTSFLLAKLRPDCPSSFPRSRDPPLTNAGGRSLSCESKVKTLQGTAQLSARNAVDLFAKGCISAWQRPLDSWFDLANHRRTMASVLVSA